MAFNRKAYMQGYMQRYYQTHKKTWKRTSKEERNYTKEYNRFKELHPEKRIQPFNYFNWIYRAYGLTIERYWKIREEQGDKCPICQKPLEEVSRISVDHDHSTGQIRGILCQNCNCNLGWNETYTREIEEYLKQYKEI